MRMMDSFNEIMNYIETTLTDEIDEKKVAQISGYSLPMFSRIFSIVTGSTLNEYIRFRKLTQSAIDLRESSEKIIDIAIKYGYESTDSFGSAFKKFHGFTPSQVRKGRQFRAVSKINLLVDIQGGNATDIIIQSKPAFKVAGLTLDDAGGESYREVWEELHATYGRENLSKLGNGRSYAMYYDIDQEERLRSIESEYQSSDDSQALKYMACYNLKNIDKARRMDLDIFEVSESEYAIIKLKRSDQAHIENIWKYLIDVFLPEQGYVHSDQPEFELISSGTKNQESSRELWIPIEREH